MGKWKLQIVVFLILVFLIGCEHNSVKIKVGDPDVPDVPVEKTKPEHKDN